MIWPRLLATVFSISPRLIAVVLPSLLGLLLLFGLPAFELPWQGEKAYRLQWSELMPQQAQAEIIPRGVVQHDGLAQTPWSQELFATVAELDGRRVEISGFMVPLTLSGEQVSEFLLVPYAGACIHVPPPPPNQIIFVQSEEPVELTGLIESVKVTGTLRAEEVWLEMAPVAYTLEAESAERG